MKGTIMNAQTIALISGTAAAIGPATDALLAKMPDVTVWNILDDRLLKEANSRGTVDEQLTERMQRLIGHATAEGADAVLLTCSMYGQVAQSSEAAIPVLAADESVFTKALTSGFGTVLVVATLESSRADTIARLTAEATRHTDTPKLLSIVPNGSFEATGNSDALLESVVRGVESITEPHDAIMLAQYSLAPIAASLHDRIGVPVLAGPQAAADDLAARIRP